DRGAIARGVVGPSGHAVNARQDVVPQRDEKGTAMNRYGLVTVVLIAPALMVGCAKQPATMTTAAPAPTGMAVTGASPTTARPESPESRPTGRSETSPLAADQRGARGRPVRGRLPANSSVFGTSSTSISISTSMRSDLATPRPSMRMHDGSAPTRTLRC